MAAETLNFIFTPEAFSIDDISDDALVGIGKRKSSPPAGEDWKGRFREDKFQALYESGFDGTEGAGKADSPSFAFLRFLAESFIEALTAMPEIELARESLALQPGEDVKARLLSAVPFALGAEYIDGEWIDGMFARLLNVFHREIAAYDGTVAAYISGKRQDLRVPERVFFHLVEKKGDEAYPFAFLATYATKDGGGEKVRHMPLQHALTEFKNDQQKLLQLLGCLNRAAEVSLLLDKLVESGEMLHPLRLTSEEAYEVLKAVPALEERGILCRIPNWWKRRASSVRLSVKFGEKAQSLTGFDAIVSMQPELTVDGVPLTKRDIQKILQETAGLAQIKGKWIEVDKERLQELLNKMEEYGGDVSFLEALRLESGMAEKGKEDEDAVTFSNGEWLASMMRNLRRPDEMKRPKVPATVHAELRPYQLSGYAWLGLMAQLGLGACLADDMGLGKTLQVLTFLESLRRHKKDARILLIVPASLLGNWEREAARFTPNIPLHILHGRRKDVLEGELRGEDTPFLTVTTYATAARLDALQDEKWDVVILDEAQAIKNPGAKQTKFIKSIPAALRIAMTGTPIENDLSNLWSLFDFLNKGLLGSAAEFKRYAKELGDNPQGYQRLRRLVSPFILRRLKTDKSIISDLPDKMEQVDYVTLSKKQTVLYRKQVEDLEAALEGGAEGIARKGIILAAIMKLKQICNHPDQFLGSGGYDPDDSGKFDLLRELCETIYEKRERVLVFTQYKEITETLAEFLRGVFHKPGLVLHGGTRIKKRAEMVETFNGEEYVPFMVLSLKAAGVGLNLTAANHVIHFDRWWNPAVENQATDRAFRIGQTKNVIVHKFVSKGTIEERIDEVIEKKRSLAESVIGAGEQWITELSDQEIISMMRLEL